MTGLFQDHDIVGRSEVDALRRVRGKIDSFGIERVQQFRTVSLNGGDVATRGLSCNRR